KIFGKKFFPSGHGSIVAAVDQANGSPASRGFGWVATKRSVASCAPAAVIASRPGGQLGLSVIEIAWWNRRKNAKASTSPTAASTGRHHCAMNAIRERSPPGAAWASPWQDDGSALTKELLRLLELV